MPSRNPATGRRLSGAAQRARAAAPPPLSEAARAAFARVGDAPEDFGEQLIWARRLLVTAASLVARDELDAGRARTLKDLLFATAATYNKSQVEIEVRKIKAALADRSRAPSFVQVLPGSKIKRPPTARGQRRGSPQLLAADAAPEPPADGDGGDVEQPDRGDDDGGAE